MVIDYYIYYDIDGVEDRERGWRDICFFYVYIYEGILLNEYSGYLGVYCGEDNVICLDW